jgi:hypothetical protein
MKNKDKENIRIAENLLFILHPYISIHPLLFVVNIFHARCNLS